MGLNRKLENRPLLWPPILIICGSGGRLLSTIGPSEDAQKHRTATPTVILVIAASLCVPFSMLFTTVNVISDTFAAAMLRCTLLPTRCLSGVLQWCCGTSFQVASACLQSWGCGSKRPFSCASFCRVLRFDRRGLQLPPSRELSVCCSSALGSCLCTPTTASSS